MTHPKTDDFNQRYELSLEQRAYLDWLCCPDDEKEKDSKGRPISQNEFARRINIPKNLLSRWRHHTDKFREAMRERFNEMHTDPVRIHKVIEAMADHAAGGNTKAAELYLQMVGEFVPKQHNINENRNISDLDDDQLILELEAEIAKSKERVNG